MAKFVSGMNVSLDGYVDHDAFAPDPLLFRHLIEQVRGATASIYGRHIYEIMRNWEEDHSAWRPEERDFDTAWRNQPKWIVSRSLTSVGPNATLISENVEAAFGSSRRKWTAGSTPRHGDRAEPDRTGPH